MHRPGSHGAPEDPLSSPALNELRKHKRPESSVMPREIRTQNVTYNARSWADTIFRWRGSVLPDVLPHLIVTGLISVGVWKLDKTVKFIEIDKTGHSMFAFFVTFFPYGALKAAPEPYKLALKHISFTKMI